MYRLALLLLTVLPCLAQVSPPTLNLETSITTISLIWDGSSSPEVTGYKLHWGQIPGQAAEQIDVGNVVRYDYAVHTYGPQHFFVTAYTPSDESGPSNTLVVTVWPNADQPAVIAGPQGEIGDTGPPGPPGPQGPPGESGVLPSPRIESIFMSDLQATYAVIAWTTDLECNGTLYYGDTPSVTQWVRSNNLGTTDHLAKTYPLVSRTHYFYKVQSVCNGQTLESPIRSFNTK